MTMDDVNIDDLCERMDNLGIPYQLLEGSIEAHVFVTYEILQGFVALLEIQEKLDNS